MEQPVSIVPPPLNLPDPSLSRIKGRRAVPSLLGRRFGSLVVESRIGVDSRHNSLWRCACDCGNSCDATAAKLNAGTKTRCSACAARARKAGPRPPKPVPTRKQALERKVLAALKRRATTEGYAWTLRDEDASALLAAPCRFCGSADAPGTIVRIYPDGGWRPDNCLPACPRCATALGTATPADFIAWSARIAENCPPGQPL
jgi:hypothetical protein